VSYGFHLEAAEWIVNFKVVEEASSSVGLVSGASAPLAGTAATTVHSCSRGMATASVFGITQSIVDEGLHAHGAHGIKEVSASRSAGFRGSRTDGAAVGIIY